MRVGRWALSAVAATTLLFGCNAVRPEGAYFPPDLTPPSLPDGAVDAASAEDASLVVAEEQVSVPTFPAQDAGAGPEDDAGALSDEEQRLSVVAGRYWARLDMDSQATVSVPLGSVSITTQISHYLITQLDLDRGTSPPTLVANEKLCFQTVSQDCSPNCSVETQVQPQAIAAARQAFVARRYTIDAAGTLSTDAPALALGYDAEPDGSVGAVPANGSDARVWDLVAGEPREGFWTTTEVAVSVIRVACNLYGAQRFVSAFAGAVPDWASGSPRMDGADASFLLDTAGTEIAAYAAEGIGCDMDSVAGAGAGAEATGASLGERVRFARLVDQTEPDETFWRCPDVPDAFVAVLPNVAPEP